jgi:transcriptional regulator with XRE-family HTH domain
MTIAETKRKLDLKTIGGRIQLYRINAGWSRKQLGERMGMSASTISGHERNAGESHPRPETIRRFAAALACKPTDLDPEYAETIDFRYTGNHQFCVVNGHEDTLARFEIDRSARYNTHEIGAIVATLARAGHRITVIGL